MVTSSRWNVVFKLPYPNLKLGSVSLMEYLGEFPNARNRDKLESEIRGKRKQRIKIGKPTSRSQFPCYILMNY